jgi:hypothetical protein
MGGEGEEFKCHERKFLEVNEETRKTTERSLSRAGLVGLVGLSQPNWVGSLFFFFAFLFLVSFITFA